MVATRRGTRGESSANITAGTTDVQGTPSTVRRTRARRSEKVTDNAAPKPTESCVPLDNPENEKVHSAVTSAKKRGTRGRRRQDSDQPSVQESSILEADVSDLESCGSVVSDVELPVTQLRTRRRQLQTRKRENEELSDVDSCSSAVSASKPGYSCRRSTRRKTSLRSPESCSPQAADANEDLPVEPKADLSQLPDPRIVTRSQRKSTRTLLMAKQRKEDSELSEPDSCASNAPAQTPRRQTRSAPRQIDELSENSQSPAPTARQTRASRRKVASIINSSEPLSCDSEGFESGPTYSLTARRKVRAQLILDSDSEVAYVSSPCSTGSRGTPTSSRAGSRTSARRSLASRRSAVDSAAQANVTLEGNSTPNNSLLDNTVVAADLDVTLKEGDEIKPADQSTKRVEVNEEVKETTEITGPNDRVTCAVSFCDYNNQGAEETGKNEEASQVGIMADTSEVETVEEKLPSCPAVKVYPSEEICEKVFETEEAEAEQELSLETPAVETVQIIDEGEHPESQPSEKVNVEIQSLKADAEQVEDAEESVQETQYQDSVKDSEREQQPKADKFKGISLLDSTDDEDELDDDDDSEPSDLEDMAKGKGETSNNSQAAGTSVEGLFMIDTRPGQDTDEQFYREGEEGKTKVDEEDVEDEEFVDEEADEDEDAKILWSSRSNHVKDMSSRIDPGINVKQLGGLYISFDGSKSKTVSTSAQKVKGERIADEVMKKSIIGPDFEKKEAVPPYQESKKALKLKRRVEREKTTGEGWFDMKAPEVTQELNRDLHVLRMRGSLDPKRFYKKNDRDGFPKYFQVGTVVDSPLDFYHSRVPKKERKRTMVEELLTDAEFRQNNKKRYQQIMSEKAAQAAGRKNKKKLKFHKKSS